MRLLIDASILLDVLQNREPHVQDSSKIWKLCETSLDTGYVTALSFANLVYVMRKELDAEMIKDVYTKMELLFRFTELSTSDLTKAIDMKWDDFEDSLQSVAAERVKADCIITRNVKDFLKSKVMALTPSEYLARRKSR
jgi:predicted nucleic acid-binding protein